jgi:hypothetical protein
MKKIAISIILLASLASCSTSTSQDTQMLQKQYHTVYRIDETKYITIDSTGAIYDVRVTMKGEIFSIVRIK